MAVELADQFMSKEDFMDRASRHHMESLNFWKSGVAALHKLLNQLTFQRDDLMSKFSQVTSEKAKLKQEYEEKVHTQSVEIGKLQSVVALLNERLNQRGKLSNDTPDSVEALCKEGTGVHNDHDTPKINQRVTLPPHQGKDVSTTLKGHVRTELGTQTGSSLKEHFTIKQEEHSFSSDKIPEADLVSFHRSKALTGNLRGQHLNDVPDPPPPCTRRSVSYSTPSSSYLVSKDVSGGLDHDKISSTSLEGPLLLGSVKGTCSTFHSESSEAQGDHSHISDYDLPLDSQDSTLFKCSWCSYTSRTLSALEPHQKKHGVAAAAESKAESFKGEVDLPKSRSLSQQLHCQECQIYFLGEAEFQNHCEIHHEPAILARESSVHLDGEGVLAVQNCSSCLQSFSSEADVKCHSASHCCDKPKQGIFSDVSTTSKSLKKAHSCQNCSVVFMSTEDYQVHLPCVAAMTNEEDRGHSSGESSLSHSANRRELPVDSQLLQEEPCPELSSPKQLSGVSSTQTFPCQICPRVFLADADLRQHQSLHHADATFPCSRCAKSFLTRTDLARHFRMHSETKGRRFKCSYCEKRFTYLKDKNRHEHVHTGYKPFQCDTCLKRFSRKDSLHTHLRTHSGEKPHHCELCGKYFSQRSGLKSHMRATHTVEHAFQCHHCQKCFKFQQSFRAHLSSHSNPT